MQLSLFSHVTVWNNEVKGVFQETGKVLDSSHFSSLGELTAGTDGPAVFQTCVDIPELLLWY